MPIRILSSLSGHSLGTEWAISKCALPVILAAGSFATADIHMALLNYLLHSVGDAVDAVVEGRVGCWKV